MYSTEEAFTIVYEDITTITVTVPQFNIGISVLFSDEIKTNFTNYHVKVYNSTGREVQINEDTSDSFYFMIPENERLHYALTATNADGEEMTSEERTITDLKAGSYQISKKAFCCNAFMTDLVSL